MIKKIIFFQILTLALMANYINGQKIFKNKCSSCHKGFIDAKRLKNNFFAHQNKILKLTAPTVNMLVYAIMRGPKKIGEEGDEFRKVEIEEYLKDALFHPSKENSICDAHISKYYDKKRSLKGEVSEKEISDLTDFFMGYEKKRAKNLKFKKIVLDSLDDTQKILQKAKKEGKLIIVKATSPTCWFCKKMDKEVFSDKDVQNLIIKDFILVEVNVDKQKLPFGVEKYYKKITPSFFIINADKKLISKLPGSWSKEDFMSFLKESKDKK